MYSKIVGVLKYFSAYKMHLKLNKLLINFQILKENSIKFFSYIFLYICLLTVIAICTPKLVLSLTFRSLSLL